MDIYYEASFTTLKLTIAGHIISYDTRSRKMSEKSQGKPKEIGLPEHVRNQ